MEINGKPYTILFSSDSIRDGFCAELREGSWPGQDDVMEVFHDDKSGSMTVTMFKAHVPLEVVETLIRLAHERLPLRAPLFYGDEDATEAE